VLRTTFKGRRAASIENDTLRLTVLEEGGHIAEVFDKRAGMSPLWIPPWPSIEPSTFASDRTSSYGTGPEAKLLAGIMGHNVCLDIFGVPSPEEFQAGLTVHGEASVDRYEIRESPGGLHQSLTLQLAQLKFSRGIELHEHCVKIHEVVENLGAMDRPLAWTQHATLGRPFLNPSTTQFRASFTRSLVADTDSGANAYLGLGREFLWPIAPLRNGGQSDLQQMNPNAPASGYTAHLTDPKREEAYFVAYEPQFRLAFGYIWKRNDFPWIGIWEENCSRQAPPWNGRTVTRGMEFGVSPFPETRREMVERNRLFDTPGFKWIPSQGRLEAEYWIVSQIADAIPESLTWPTV
jgi:hypothetical protein